MRLGTGFESTYLPHLDIDCMELTGHDERWSEDFAALIADGCRLVRYPVRWHRVEAEPGSFDFRQTDTVLHALWDAGVEVIVDLVHHTSYPRWLTGGFADPRFPVAFRRYAAEVLHRYPSMSSYTLFNEPFATLFLCAHEALWPPYLHGDRNFAEVLNRTLPAIHEIACEWNEALPHSRHVWVDTCEHHRGVGPAASYVAECNDRRYVLLDLLLGRDLSEDRPYLRRLLESGGEPLLHIAEQQPMPIDVLGLDYYAHSEWWYDEAGGHAPSPYPRGLAALISDYASRYPGLALMLTETNTRGTPHERAVWWRYILAECALACSRGAPLEAAMWFPYIDSAAWDSLLAVAGPHIDPVGIRSVSIEGEQLACVASEMTVAWQTSLRSTRATTTEGLGGTTHMDTADKLSEPFAQRLRGFPLSVPKETIVTRSRTPDLVVLSHLRWTWVWQRPQHLVSRLAQARSGCGAATWFVEEPVHACVPEPQLAMEERDGIRRVWLEIPTPEAGSRDHVSFNDPAAETYGELLRALLPEEVDVWLYTPMALEVAGHLRQRVLFHDVMDDLASFAKAPEGLQLLHRRALDEADVVTCGGRSLHAMVAQRRGRANTHLFPSGVDAAHFARARHLRRTPDRVAGYVGVIDERLDLQLIHDLALHLSDWEIRIVGPVAKIDERDLPRLPNIVYPGMATYEQLPEVMAGFSVALMPFALNDATRSISPTKTLEYLAAGLPVVSTRVPDVVADHSRVVHLADDGSSFAQACRHVAEHDVLHRDRAAAVLQREREWDVIAARMGQLLDEAAQRSASRIGATA